MKQFVILAVLAASCAMAYADNPYNGYVRKDGTYVAPHYQTAPDSTRSNNYSAQGNTNPYTGKQGYVDPYKAQQEYKQPRPEPLYKNNTGPRNGAR